MINITDKKELSLKNVWMISPVNQTGANQTQFDFTKILEGADWKHVKEYKISDLARYMLNPHPVIIYKELIGCKVIFKKSLTASIIDKIKNLFLKNHEDTSTDRYSTVLVSNKKIDFLSLKDKDLKKHLSSLNDLLAPYDSTIAFLSKLDVDNVADITGICKDIGDNKSFLTLQGSIQDKINYVTGSILKKVKVILEKSYLSNGLFEMRGYDFESYDPSKTYRLLKISVKGKSKYCLLGPDNKLEFWVEDDSLVNFMFLLEQSIKKDAKFYNFINLCLNGKAKAQKIFINRQFEIDYSRKRIPAIYKKVFKMHDMKENEKDIVVNSLNNLQLGIAFNYVPLSDSGEKRLYTNISVMHDLKALEPIKTSMPAVYSEINKQAAFSEAGRYYLLDSIMGYQNV